MLQKQILGITRLRLGYEGVQIWIFEGSGVVGLGCRLYSLCTLMIDYQFCQPLPET